MVFWFLEQEPIAPEDISILLKISQNCITLETKPNKNFLFPIKSKNMKRRERSLLGLTVFVIALPRYFRGTETSLPTQRVP
jgi:hypothetical protein